MAFRVALRNAFSLLREHPRLFVPRLVMTLVWSGYWLMLIDILRDPFSATLEDIFLLSIFTAVMMPVQISVYNAYYVLVKQSHDTDPRLRSAFRYGLKKLPQSLAVFALLGTMLLVFGMPGALLYLYGTMTQTAIFQVAGFILSGAAVIGVMFLSYFTPISVVLGEKSFFENIKEGISASRKERREIILLTILSFTTLFVAELLQGGFEYLGIIGFFGGRIIAAVMSVYVLVVNPELFLHMEEEEKEK